MDRFDITLTFGEQTVRIVVWRGADRSWRAAIGRRLADGRLVVSGRPPIGAGAWPEEALGKVVALIARSLLPREVTWLGRDLPSGDPPLRALPAVAPVPPPAADGATEPAPRPTREERAAELTATVDAAIERLAGELSRGFTDGFRALLAFWSRFHKYSVNNALLIMAQRPDATLVAGLKRWNRLGWRVRPGEKALWIWAPLLRNELDAVTGEEVEVLVGFKPAPVFAAEQLADLDKKPMPTAFAPLPDDAEALYQAIRLRVERAGINVEERPLIGGVQGVSHGGRIVVKQGLDSRNRLFVLLHELGHELEHHGPDKRNLSPEWREFQAESAAFVAAAALGLEIPTSRDYLLSHKATAEDLRAAFGGIQALVKRMLAIVLPEDQQPERAAA